MTQKKGIDYVLTVVNEIKSQVEQSIMKCTTKTNIGTMNPLPGLKPGVSDLLHNLAGFSLLLFDISPYY